MSHITRQKSGQNYRYFYGDEPITNTAEIKRIKALAIPPAWTDVEIAKSPSAKILARGTDKAGRKQAMYNPAFREKREKEKYEKILSFAKQLPVLRQQVSKDIKKHGLPKEKVVACVVSLIDDEYFRVGNKTYAKENNHYGVTTLRSKHIADMTGQSVTFSFIGKSGKKHVKQITNPQLVRIIKKLDETPGHELFRYETEEGYQTISSNDVNEYIHEVIGEDYSAKDFRTWGATLLATSYILQEKSHDATSKAKQKVLTGIVKKVARKLGNTPAITKQSYIDPRVLEAFTEGASLTTVRTAMKHMKPKKYRTIEEQCVLKLLGAT